ncbi:MAG: transposase [Clostridia bacterium]|nr:transposase [Clostridia bacterium]
MDLPNRKPNRLKGWNYNNGASYYVTVCTHQKQNTLSLICRDSPCGCPHIKLTDLGEIVQNVIYRVENKYSDFVVFDNYVIMPNHLHLIVSIKNEADERTAARAVPTLSKLIGEIKSCAAVDWIRHCKSNSIDIAPVWQRSYYDHVIRCQQDYEEIWRYIDENPYKRIRDF